MKYNIQQIRDKVLPILQEAGVTRSSIFGSYVRGEQRDDSDIDILIDLPKNKSLFDFVGLKLQLEDALQKKVDLVEYQMIKARIRDRILREQIPIL